MVAFVMFLAVFTQSVTGFGSALVSMSLLPQIVGIRIATPLVALMGGLLEAVLLIRFRRAINLNAVRQVTVASLAGAPIGILALRQVDERVILTVLGALLAGYGLYGLLGPRLPVLTHPVWGYVAGFLGGALGGAYNTSGPPVIVYGDCRRWQPAEFKGNLQGYLLVNSAIVIAGHAWSQNFTPAVWDNLWSALPAIGLGVLAGLGLERRINPEAFRRIVQWVLVIMGARLMVG